VVRKRDRTADYIKNKDKILAQKKMLYMKNKKKIIERISIWAKNNRNKINVNRQKRDISIKFEVLSHYSKGIPKCICCGENIINFLTIDHIKNDGAAHRKLIKNQGGRIFYRWLKRNNYPKGYQVLCFNCNCGKQLNFGICPHEEIRKRMRLK